MKITFCGAARIVTGSCYYIESGKEKLIIDCGMFQGTKEITRMNYLPFKFNPKQIKYLFLTHAHIDHAGLIPKLRKEGFKGKIFATAATVDLAKIMLEDSANLQESETNMENLRFAKEGLPLRKPLYTTDDVRKSFQLFKKIEYDKFYQITKNIKVRYRDAGHIIGSAIIELYIKENHKEIKLVFSGDLGQWDVPIVKNPTLIQDADYVFLESTYGNREHEDIGIRDDLLLDYAKETFKKGGKLFIPSFAIERTQELLYSFNKLIRSGKFPDEKIFLDSPLAVKATEIFKKHKECFDEEALYRYKDPFDFKNLVYTPSVEESKKINTYKKPCVVIAGSGMCNGGRIRHHFKNGISDPKNTVLFVGFQAEGTLGRIILEGAKRIRMMGLEVDVRADIRKINSFSAHADYKDLIRWMDGFKGIPKKVFIVHGEPSASESLKMKLELRNFSCYIPYIGEKITI